MKWMWKWMYFSTRSSTDLCNFSSQSSVGKTHLSLSRLGWPSSTSLSLSHSHFCRAAALPWGQTHPLSSAAARTRSSRSSSGGRHTPGLASRTQSGRSSPCSRCTWQRTACKGEAAQSRGAKILQGSKSSNVSQISLARAPAHYKTHILRLGNIIGMQFF